MSESSNNTKSAEEMAVAHERAQSLVRSGLKVIVFSILIGLVGGYLVYYFMPPGEFPRFLLFIPGLVAVVALGLPVRMRKKKWFPNSEDLKEALEYRPPGTEK